MAEDPKNIGIAQQNEESLVKDKTGTYHNTEKITPRMLFFCITFAAILLLSIGGWFVFKHFFASNDAENKSKNEHIEENYNVTSENKVFLSVPEILVNLRSTKPKGNVLRATFMLQIYNKEDEPKIREFLPIILDQLLTYLRDQTVSDLEGSGLERMRQALLVRINNVVHPLKIHRVIIKDFIIQ